MEVHALLYGFPLCNFSNKVPKDWPPGNQWVSVDQIENITCQICKEKAKEIKENKS